ncbi:MAG: ADP-ribosyl-(dinitrogen reductase) hydrolase [Burkholderiales bacterium]
MNINCTPKVLQKLSTEHNVDITEVRQCFINRHGIFLLDPRAKHKTNPATEWFIAETNSGRKLKVCFVQVGMQIDIKTAYEPNEIEVSIYNRNAYI